MPRQPVQKRIRRRMIRLPRIAQHPRRTREQHEQVKLQPPCRPVQMPRPHHLRPQHPLESPPVLVRQRRIRQHPDAVNHTGQRRQPLTDAPEHRLHRLAVRHIRHLHLDPHPPRAKPFQRRLDLRVRRPATVEHNRPRTVLGKPHRQLPAYPPETTRHQIRPVATQTTLGQARPRRLLRRHPTHQPRPVTHPATMRHLRLTVRRQQLLDQRTHIHLTRGVEVQQPRPQPRRLKPHRAAQPPQRRAREHPFALATQRLRPTRHQPHPTRRHHIRIEQPLHQRQRTPTPVLDVREQPLRGRLLPATIEPRQMHHSTQTLLTGEPLDERAPRLATMRLHMRHRHTRGLLCARPRNPLTRQHHTLATLHQPRRQPTTRPPTVRRQQPQPLRLLHLSRPPRHYHPLRRIHPTRHHRHLPVPRIPQRTTPHPLTHQRTIRAVPVPVTPPPLQQPERQVQPTLTPQPLHTHQHPRRRQKGTAVRERLPQVARRMQHVRRHHHVVPVRLVPLPHRVALNVQHPVDQRRPPSTETPLRPRKEPRRDIRVRVLDPPRRQRPQHRPRRPTSPRTHLQHTHTTTPGQHPHQTTHHLAHLPIHRPRQRRLVIQRLRPPSLTTEQQLQPLHTTTQHIGERRTAPTQQPKLHTTERITRPHRLQKLPSAPNPPGAQAHTRHPARLRHHQPLRRPLKNDPLLQHPEQPVQQPLVLNDHLQRTTQLRRTHHRPRLTTPPQPHQRLPRIPPRKPLQVNEERRRRSRLDPFQTKMHPKVLHTARHHPRRLKKLRRAKTSHQRPLTPHHVVEQLPHPSDRREQRRTRRACQLHPANAPHHSTVHRMQPHIRHPHVRCALPLRIAQPHPTQHPLRQRLRQPQPLPTRPQPHLPRARLARHHRQRLETTAENRRRRDAPTMRRRIARLRRPRHDHLHHRLTTPRPHRLHHPQPRPRFDAHLRQPLVEGLRRHRLQPRLQPLHIRDAYPRLVFGLAQPRNRATLRMQHPPLVTTALAVDLDHARGRLLRSHHHLQRPLRRLRFFAGNHQRGMQPHRLHHHRTRAAHRLRRRVHQRTMRRRRHHHPPEHPVLAQPRRHRRRQLRLPGDLASGRVPPLAQQRMAPHRPTTAQPLHPVTTTLERIRRQRQTTAQLARVQSLELQTEARLPRSGYRLDEAVPLCGGGSRPLSTGDSRSRSFRGCGLSMLRGCGSKPRDQGAALTRQHHRDISRRPRLRKQRSEHRPGTQLDDHIHTHSRQRPHPRPVRHRSARMTAPVRTVQQLTLPHHPTRHVAHQRHHRRPHLDAPRRRLDAVQHRLHQPTVKRMTRHQTTTPHTRFNAPPLQRLHPRNQPAHHTVRPVVRRDLHPLRSTLLNQPLHPLRRGEHRRHRPRVRRKTPHQLPAHRRQPQPLLQPVHPRHMRRRKLPHAVSQHRHRTHPNALPQRRQRTPQRIQRRLRPRRVIKTPHRPLATEHHVEQRLAPQRHHLALAPLQHRAHHRLAPVQLPAHPRPLAALTGEQERHPHGVARTPPALGDQPLQTAAQLLQPSEHHPRTVLEAAAPHTGRPRHVREQRIHPGGGSGRRCAGG